MTEKRPISLGRQELVAYEGDTEVFRRFISSGDPTPDGTYNIQVKMPSKHMGLGELSPGTRCMFLLVCPGTVSSK